MAASLTDQCMNGDIEGARSAIESGADLNVRSPDGKTPLMYALWNNQNSVVELLMQNDNVDVNCEDNEGATALHHAVDVDNGEGARMLLADIRLQDINHKNKRGLTPLMRAVARQKVNCATVLLSDSRVDLDARDNYKRSPQELKRWENFDVLNSIVHFVNLQQLFNQTISFQVGESRAAACIKSSSRRSLRCGLPPLPAEGLPARDEGGGADKPFNIYLK